MSQVDVQQAMRRLRARLIASAHLLDKPFTDQPELSPWDLIERDLATLDAAIKSQASRD